MPYWTGGNFKMIMPQPESDLSITPLVVGADIIKILKKSQDYLIIEDLMNEFLGGDKKRYHELFFDTLTFLFALGLVNENKYKIKLINDNTQTNLF